MKRACVTRGHTIIIGQYEQKQGDHMMRFPCSYVSKIQASRQYRTQVFYFYNNRPYFHLFGSASDQHKHIFFGYFYQKMYNNILFWEYFFQITSKVCFCH